MRIFLVRHGETEENAANICIGHAHGKLSKRGKEQIKRLGERLKKEKIDAIFSSDLGRAIETAKEVARFHDLEVIEESRLREMNLGEFEGRPAHEYGEARRKSGMPTHLFKPRGGENLVEVKNRALNFFSELKEKYKGRNVLVVSHAMVNRVVLASLMGISIENANAIFGIKQDNACVNVIELANGKPKVKMLNDTSHLSVSV